MARGDKVLLCIKGAQYVNQLQMSERRGTASALSLVEVIKIKVLR